MKTDKKLALLMLVIAALSTVFVFSSCTDESATRRTLKSAGYSDIQTTGYEMFECGEDDTYHTGFTAKNPKGEVVSGTVCCGLISKGCTIRF